jgi:L-alanine-DL-glutamate epimerase-like enolase superfamily enzyme
MTGDEFGSRAFASSRYGAQNCNRENLFQPAEMKLTIVSRAVHTRRAFRISRARNGEIRNVFVRLDAEGFSGHGEASPNAFYGETWEATVAVLEQARPWLETMQIRSVADLEAAWLQAWELVAPSRGAQCAIDLALWDWLAQREGVSVSELAWSTPPRALTTFCTLGLSTPEELPEKVTELAPLPHIKIKSDASASMEPVRAVRAQSEALLAVDANCAWSAAHLEELSEQLAALAVTFIEQPFPPAEKQLLKRGSSRLPVFADENCVAETDVDEIAEHFDGFNIKLVKCGGITPARRMVLRGRELGLEIMVGCMLESSALIAAGAAIAQRTDYADLDGAWLLADDPFRGWDFDAGVLRPPNEHGLGAAPELALFGL